MGFVGKKIAQEKVFYIATRPINICDFNVDSIDILKLVRTKTNSKHLIRYFDKAIRPLVLNMLRNLTLKRETIN